MASIDDVTPNTLPTSETPSDTDTDINQIPMSELYRRIHNATVNPDNETNEDIKQFADALKKSTKKDSDNSNKARHFANLLVRDIGSSLTAPFLGFQLSDEGVFIGVASEFCNIPNRTACYDAIKLLETEFGIKQTDDYDICRGAGFPFRSDTVVYSRFISPFDRIDDIIAKQGIPVERFDTS